MRLYRFEFAEKFDSIRQKSTPRYTAWRGVDFLLDNAKLKILFPAMRKVRSPMADIFFIDCYFNCLCKGRKNFILTPRYAAQRGVDFRIQNRFSP
jgi:hypothetical protein